MPQYLTIFAVALAAYAGASWWALPTGIAALTLLAVGGEGVTTRVLATADVAVVRFSLRQTVANVAWACTAAYALGLIVKLIYA